MNADRRLARCLNGPLMGQHPPSPIGPDECPRWVRLLRMPKVAKVGCRLLNRRCRPSQSRRQMSAVGTVHQRRSRADSGHSPDRDGTARFGPELTFITTPDGGRVG
jgi:hypothetical protein